MSRHRPGLQKRHALLIRSSFISLTCEDQDLRAFIFWDLGVGPVNITLPDKANAFKAALILSKWGGHSRWASGLGKFGVPAEVGLSGSSVPLTPVWFKTAQTFWGLWLGQDAAILDVVLSLKCNMHKNVFFHLKPSWMRQPNEVIQMNGNYHSSDLHFPSGWGSLIAVSWSYGLFLWIWLCKINLFGL